MLKVAVVVQVGTDASAIVQVYVPAHRLLALAVPWPAPGAGDQL
jgi:hypothetical protein